MDGRRFFIPLDHTLPQRRAIHLAPHPDDESPATQDLCIQKRRPSWTPSLYKVLEKVSMVIFFVVGTGDIAVTVVVSLRQASADSVD